MDLALVQCPNCLKVFQYYDYISHTEICRNYKINNSISNEDIDADDENEQDLENPARKPLKHYQQDLENSARKPLKHYQQDLENPARKPRKHYQQDLENPARKSNNKQDLENPARKPLKHYQQDLENPNINSIYYSNNYNNNNNGTSSFELFNPMFNRGFYNNINNNMNNNNSLENLVTNIENLDIGLGCENIEQYGCKIIISEVIECAICLNNYDIGSEFYLMKCLHSFCKICAEIWFDSRSFCPLCKANLKI